MEPTVSPDPIQQPNQQFIPPSPQQPMQPNPTQQTFQPTPPDTQYNPYGSYGPTISGMGMETPKSKWSKWKMPLIVAAVVLVVVGGSAAAYFGYYKSPTTIWQQALTNTGQGYDRLASYADSQAKTHYKSGKVNGSYKITADGITADGTLQAVSDGKNSQSTLSFGASGVRVNAEVRTIQAKDSTNPDIYVKVSGLKGLGTLLGGADSAADTTSLANTLNGLDNQWYSIDHTLLDQLENTASQNAQQSSASAKMPTEEEVMDGVRALGAVNKQYLFTTDSSKAVATNVKKVATEKRNNRNTYHYQVTVNKDHMAAYASAAGKAIDQSKLGAWIKNTSGKTLSQQIDTNQIKKDLNDSKVNQLDVWVDTATRTIQSIRFPDSSDPVNNYLDLGLNYTGGSKYPFTVSGRSKDSGTTTTYNLTFTLDTKAHTLALNGGGSTSGDSATKFSFDATAQPGNDTVNVTAPAGAKSLLELLGNLGINMDSLTSDNSQNNDSGTQIAAHGFIPQVLLSL